jgi:hypothetical protein
MHPRMIWTIFRKDLRDAIRDGRVLVAVLFPIALGIFYGAVFDQQPARPSASAAYAAAGPSRLPDLLRAVVAGSLDLNLSPVASADQVRQRVTSEKADLGFVLPPGFDAAVARGASPLLTVYTRHPPGAAANALISPLNEALQRLAGQRPPATIEVTTVEPATESRFIFDRLGAAPYFVITNALFGIVMVALFAVPAILTEEGERKTLDALVLIASYGDVIVAKALVGLVYIAVSVSLLLAITRSVVAEPPAFIAVILLLSLTLIGFGLLLGGLFRSLTQLNTWSSLILLPVVTPIFAIGFPVPNAINALLSALPTSQATRLAIDAFTGQSFFGGDGLSYLVVAAWGGLAYALVLWRLAHRED